MIPYTCPSCGNVKQLPDDLAGRRVQCKKCGTKGRADYPVGKAAEPSGEDIVDLWDSAKASRPSYVPPEPPAPEPPLVPRSQPAEAEGAKERVFYRGDSAFISTDRVTLNGTLYSVPNMTSVGVRKIPPHTCLPVLFILAGIFITIMFVLMMAATGKYESANFIPVGFGLLLLGLGINAVRIAKPLYVVRIGMASGEVDGLRTFDQQFAFIISEAISQAIVSHSRGR